MPDLRRDPTTGDWMVTAPERARRPDQFNKVNADEVKCPFCCGHEQMTPPESLAYRPGDGAPDTPGWLVRVVPNKFPVFIASDSFDIAGAGLYYQAKSVGGHEVIVHTPEHGKAVPDLTVDQLSLVLRAYKERYLHFKTEKAVDFVEIIVNHGKDAGASLEHSHAQLFAMPVIPPAIQKQLAGTLEYARANGRCVHCDMIESERRIGERVVFDNNRFVAFAPYASRLPFETRILPAEHQPFFEEIDEANGRALASTLIAVLGKYRERLNDPSFNLFLNTTPCKTIDRDYHWHIDIIPKLTTIAGFEFGTGMMINVITPEYAASHLR